eukprot:comp18428_c0_seq1/m.19674 comp18428_c0_seq1/g.19674  ORF comp18428_c0_seq1/g.19674 comp18428_c0_seq1/m.19674 type:complete len:247 (-) comp18428_c0_seq1:676-1416(-)
MGTKVSKTRRDPPPGSINPFDHLPDELLRVIVDNLAQKDVLVFRATCRRFCALSRDRTRWRMRSGTLADHNRRLSNVAKAFPGLRSLSVAGCKHLTDHCSESLGHFTQLRRLGLDHCSQISDVTLQNAVACMPHLTHVNVTMCRRLTDYGVGLLGLLEDLEVLSIAFCNLVTDRALESLAEGGTLQQLNAAHCPLITSHGVRRLVEGCPRMHMLNVLGCPDVASDPSTVTYLVGRQGLKLVMTLKH